MVASTIAQRNSHGRWARHGRGSIVGRLKGVGAACGNTDLDPSKALGEDQRASHSASAQRTASLKPLASFGATLR